MHVQHLPGHVVDNPAFTWAVSYQHLTRTPLTVLTQELNSINKGQLATV